MLMLVCTFRTVCGLRNNDLGATGRRLRQVSSPFPGSSLSLFMVGNISLQSPS